MSPGLLAAAVILVLHLPGSASTGSAVAASAASAVACRQGPPSAGRPLIHDQRLIARWVRATDPRLYAGTYNSLERGGIVRVGFIRDQWANVMAVRRLPCLVARSRIVPFPRRP